MTEKYELPYEYLVGTTTSETVSTASTTLAAPS